MELNSIRLVGFRNVADQTVDLSPGVNALIGENAQGKTNLLEAIYLLACGKSFRVPRPQEMIRHGEDRAEVRAVISGDSLPFSLAYRLTRKKGREILKNGVKLEKLSEFLGLFRVVLFCPEHLFLVKSGPGQRRSFLDAAICQIRPYYASVLAECNKIEQHRAALLKQMAERPFAAGEEYLGVWDEKLARASVKVAFLRNEYVSLLKAHAPAHFSAISGGAEKLSLHYQSDVFEKGASPEEMERSYLKKLKESRDADQKYGFTQKGVQRDDLFFLVNGYAARTFASQGQQRSLVLALKLAEGEISREQTGAAPLYLLDDVLSELDEGRRAYITRGLSGKQVILTGTEERDLAFAPHRIYVSKGEFFNEKPDP